MTFYTEIKWMRRATIGADRRGSQPDGAGLSRVTHHKKRLAAPFWADISTEKIQRTSMTAHRRQGVRKEEGEYKEDRARERG